VCFLIAGGPALWRHGHDPATRRRTRAGVRWGLITGALIAGYSVIDGYAIKVLAIGPGGVRLRLQCAAGAAATAHAAGPARRRSGRPGARSGAMRWWWRTLGPLGYILVLYALQLAPLSHVAPAREVSMLVAAACWAAGCWVKATARCGCWVRAALPVV
jgi:hypothetical protein